MPERGLSACLYAPRLRSRCGAGVRCRGDWLRPASRHESSLASIAGEPRPRDLHSISRALRRLLMREHLFGALIVYLLLVATQLAARDSGGADGENGDPEEREEAP